MYATLALDVNFWHALIAIDEEICDEVQRAGCPFCGGPLVAIDYAAPDEMAACLSHVLDAAGNSALITKELQSALVDHAAGNYRVMMNTADELLSAAYERQKSVLDEKLFLEVFATAPRRASARRR